MRYTAPKSLDPALTTTISSPTTYHAHPPCPSPLPIPMPSSRSRPAFAIVATLTPRAQRNQIRRLSPPPASHALIAGVDEVVSARTDKAARPFFNH